MTKISLTIQIDLPEIPVTVAEEITDQLQCFEVDHICKPRLERVLRDVLLPNLVEGGHLSKSVLQACSVRLGKPAFLIGDTR